MTYMAIHERGVTDISIRLSWATDWPREETRNPALPYLATQLIAASGTPDMRPQEVIQVLDERNSYMVFDVSTDDATLEFEYPNNYSDAVLPVVKALLTTPKLEQRWLDRIAKNFKENQRGNNDLLHTQVFKYAAFAILGQDPVFDFLKLPDLAPIDEVTLGDVTAWHHAHFHTKPQSIVVTGAISSSDAMDVVDELLTDLPDPIFVPQTGGTPFSIPAGALYVHMPEAQTTYLSAVGPLPVSDYKDRHADNLAITAFGTGIDAPLNAGLRQDLRATYGFWADIFRYDPHTRAVGFGGEIEGAKLAKAVDVMSKAYDEFVSSPNLSGLSRLRDERAQDMHDRSQSVNGAARLIERTRLDPLAPDPALDVWDYIQDLKSGDVTARVKDHFPCSDAMLIIAGGPRLQDWPDACVVRSFSDVTACLTK